MTVDSHLPIRMLLTVPKRLEIFVSMAIKLNFGKIFEFCCNLFVFKYHFSAEINFKSNNQVKKFDSPTYSVRTPNIQFKH
jgi:hypothetical protein